MFGSLAEPKFHFHFKRGISHMSSQAPPDQRRGLALALLAATQFVLILDASIVNVALPSIGRDLAFAPQDLSWVANAYTLTFGGFLLLGGRIADLTGRRRVFMAGLGLFVVASIAGALSVTPLMLVVSRAAQGIGAALISPAALSLLMTLFPAGKERNRALGVWGAVAGAGGAAGSILGGVLTEWFGWQAVLWVNVPIGIAALALAPRLLPEARDPYGVRSFDIAGAITVTAGLAVGVYALVDGNDAGWTSTQTLGLGALSIALLGAFLAIESRSAHPLVPLRIFRERELRGANILSIFITAAMFPMFFVLTLFLQQVKGYSPLEAGLGQLPFALSLIAVAGLASRLVTRIGYKMPLIAGLLIITAALTWFSNLSPDGSYFGDVFGPTLLAGAGGALMFIPVTIAATAKAKPEQAGLASGLINTTQQVGGAIGLALLVAVATARTASVFAAGEQSPAVALTDGFQVALLTGAGLAFIAALLAVVLLPNGTKAALPKAPEAEPVPVGAGV
jgi:EmrB/QacA subfamily drug resistance transporter